MIFGFVLSSVIALASVAPGVTFDLAEVAGRVDAEQIRDHVEVLASDRLEGRRPGTDGGRMAAAYIETALDRTGLRPALEDGTFRQQVPLHQSRPLPATQLDLWVFGDRISLELGADYLLHTWGPASAIPQRTPMVFVGHGIVAPEFDHNDYADVDVRGAVVVYLAGEPDFFAGEKTTVYAAAESKRRIALSRGAVASLLVPTAYGDTRGAWQRLRTLYGFPGLELPGVLPSLPSFVLNPELAEMLFEDALYDYEQVRVMERTDTLRAFHLPITMTFRGRFSNRDFLSPNLVALVRGSDPQLARTAVVVSAHYDHFGIATSGTGDRIFNGAVDNALGVGGVLEIARVVAGLPRAPRRSIIFLFTTAEEEGLLGARHFLSDPPIPTSRMVANVNVDGLAFRDTFSDLVVVGGELSDVQDRLLEAVQPLGMHLGKAPRELWMQDGFARSDQLAFAEAGVPAVMVNEGFTWDQYDRAEAVEQAIDWITNVYHTPGDDLDQGLNFEAAERHVQALLGLVLTLADDPIAPKWDPQTVYAYERALAQARGR